MSAKTTTADSRAWERPAQATSTKAEKDPNVKEKINLGFIGCGGFSGGNLYPALQYAPANCVAVCDLVAEKAEEYRRRYVFDRCYTDHREMFEKEDLDAVMIVMGPQGHHPLAIEAMRAGLHVYVEKPPAPTAKDALEMVQVSKETGKYCQVGFMKRFATGNLMAKQAAAQEAFGKLQMLDVKYVSSPFGGGREERFTLDYHVHPFDLVHYFLGDSASIFCRRVETAPGKVGFSASIQHSSGAVSYVNVNSFHGWGNVGDRVELTGENQYVVVDNLVKATLFRNPPLPWNREVQFYPEVDALTWEPNWLFPTPQNGSLYHNGYAREVIHFAESVRKNEFTGPSIADGYKAVALVEAMRKSIAERREVEVENELA